MSNEQDRRSEPADLRQASRAPIKLRVDYERMNSFFADYTKNISKGGTFIKTLKPLPLGTRFTFALSVPALSEPVQLTGEVTWTMTPEQAQQAGENEEPGMGIRFIFQEASEQQDLEDLVERMMDESLGPEVTKSLLQK
jgi:type IV pilus assembly protein PilZ